jgi:hypothetical protein
MDLITYPVAVVEVVVVLRIAIEFTVRLVMSEREPVSVILSAAVPLLKLLL